MPLTNIASGDTVYIERVELPEATQLRLSELGLMPGERLQVIRNQHPCPLVLGMGPARLMLGRDFGGGIQVRRSALGTVPTVQA